MKVLKQKRKLITKLVKYGGIACLVGTLWLGKVNDVHGHGYVQTPQSRAYMGYRDNSISWAERVIKYGAAANEPQSIEGDGSLAMSGNPSWWHTNRVADGRFASGGLANFSQLDLQRDAYWNTTDIKTGLNHFTWHFTAPHRTNHIKYFITKEDWDPNTPLKNDELDLLEVFEYNGALPVNPLQHQVEIPANRSGYHVVLSVWDVFDTNKAFYQVIDVNIINNEVDPDPGCCPDVTDPDVTDPDVTDPDVTDPDVTDPDVTDPNVESFDPTKVYLGGEIVSYQGDLYRAKWWTQGGIPATSMAWEIIPFIYEDGSVDFRLATVYVAGDLVRYNGKLYRAKWWTQGVIPTNSIAWELIGFLEG